MRKLLLIFLVIKSLNVSASNYFFSSTSGDDSRSTSEAQNEQTPWKSLAKLNAIMNILLPGDVISFNEEMYLRELF